MRSTPRYRCVWAEILIASIFTWASPCLGQIAEKGIENAPTIMTGSDRRPSISLNGEWASIVDPFFSGLFSFHHQEKANGWFLNRKAEPGDPFPTEYDFSKSPKLKVPGDWNTQRESLLFYEGPMWYERDFEYQPKEHTRIFLHVGAANYRSWFWVNAERSANTKAGTRLSNAM